MFRTT